MARTRVAAAFLGLRRLLELDRPDTDGDGPLLERFVRSRDERAFAAIVQRHGSMVMAVCRRVLRQDQDAEDAFQATFLVLARKAQAIQKQRSAGSWLHGVAYRTALKARTTSWRRRRHEDVVRKPDVACLAEPAGHDELRQMIDEELQCLPERLRTPLVLCYLEGKSKDEAAKELNWPNGTVSSRLSRGRALLRDRLLRRGVALSSATAALAVAAEVRGEVPASLVATVRDSALAFAAGRTGSQDAPAASLAQGVLRTMFWTKSIKALSVGALGLGLAIGAGYYGMDPSAVAQNPDGADKGAAKETEQEFKIHHLRHALAADVATTLGQLYGLKTARSDSPTIVADTKSNSLLVRANKKYGDEIAAIVQRLDEPSAEPDKRQPAPKRSERVRELIRKKRDLAKEELEFLRKQVEGGRASLMESREAARRLAMAERELDDRASLLPALASYLKLMTDSADFVRRRFQAGQLSASELNAAEYYRVEAEQWLEEAK